MIVTAAHCEPWPSVEVQLQSPLTCGTRYMQGGDQCQILAVASQW